MIPSSYTFLHPAKNAACPRWSVIWANPALVRLAPMANCTQIDILKVFNCTVDFSVSWWILYKITVLKRVKVNIDYSNSVLNIDYRNSVLYLKSFNSKDSTIELGTIKLINLR